MYEWWKRKRWIFNGREIVVSNPDAPHLSVIAITPLVEVADYMIDLHNSTLERDKSDEETEKV